MINFNQISYKKRFTYLIVGALIFLLFISQFLLKKTMDLYFENRNLNLEVERAESAPKGKQLLERKLLSLNNSLAPYIIDSNKNRDYLLRVVTEFCSKNRIVLNEFPEANTYDGKDFIIETNTIIAEGRFVDLLKLVYEIEQRNKLGRPASVHFQKQLDSRTKKLKLTVTIYLQNIKIKDGKLKS